MDLASGRAGRGCCGSDGLELTNVELFHNGSPFLFIPVILGATRIISQLFIHASALAWEPLLLFGITCCLAKAIGQ